MSKFNVGDILTHSGWNFEEEREEVVAFVVRDGRQHYVTVDFEQYPNADARDVEATDRDEDFTLWQKPFAPGDLVNFVNPWDSAERKVLSTFEHEGESYVIFMNRNHNDPEVIAAKELQHV